MFGPEFLHISGFFPVKQNTSTESCWEAQGTKMARGKAKPGIRIAKTRVVDEYGATVNLGSIWVFPKIGVPQNGWFIMENPIKRD